MKKTIGQSKPLRDGGAKKAPDPKLRAELIDLVRKLEDSDDGAIIRNVSTEGYKLIRLDELKKAVILLTRILVDE